MRRRIALSASLLIALIAAPGSGSASHGEVELTTIAGHITDVFGSPVRACVTAYGYAGSPGAVSSATDGAYSIDVVPGRHTVVVDDVVEFSGRIYCPFNGGTFWRYERQSRVVSTTGGAGPADFVLSYEIGGGVWGDVCCLESAGKPGAQVQLYAQVALEAADHIDVRWTDETSGETVTVPRWPDFWQEEYGIAGFATLYEIPSDRPDGVYRSTFSTVNPHGLRVTDSLSVETIVDSTPPTITETFPAQGAVVATAFEPWLRAADELAGLATSRTVMHLRDLTTGQQLPKVWNFDGTTRIRAREVVTLEPGHAYEATFEVRDSADNLAARTVTFTAGPGGEFGAHAPTGYITDPHTPVEVMVGANLDPSTLEFTVSNITTGGGAILQSRPHYDPSTGRAWMQPGDEVWIDQPGKMPRLTPGEYQVEVRARHLGTGLTRRLRWTFVVQAF